MRQLIFGDFVFWLPFSHPDSYTHCCHHASCHRGHPKACLPSRQARLPQGQSDCQVCLSSQFRAYHWTGAQEMLNQLITVWFLSAKCWSLSLNDKRELWDWTQDDCAKCHDGETSRVGRGEREGKRERETGREGEQRNKRETERRRGKSKNQ